MKTCKLCGKEHDRRSDFCSLKCKNQYYYQKNNEHLKECKRKKYLENKEKYKENHDRWIQENRDKWNKYQREYKRKEKEEKCQEYT